MSLPKFRSDSKWFLDLAHLGQISSAVCPLVLCSWTCPPSCRPQVLSVSGAAVEGGLLCVSPAADLDFSFDWITGSPPFQILAVALQAGRPGHLTSVSWSVSWGPVRIKPDDPVTHPGEGLARGSSRVGVCLPCPYSYSNGILGEYVCKCTGSILYVSLGSLKKKFHLSLN